MSASTKFIDLDAVDLPIQLEVKLGGQRHVLVPVSVENFVANTKALQGMTLNEGNFEQEVEVLAGVIMRSFPTITREMLNKMPLVNMQKLVAVAQEQDGTSAVAAEVEKEATANPPQAAA